MKILLFNFVISIVLSQSQFNLADKVAFDGNQEANQKQFEQELLSYRLK